MCLGEAVASVAVPPQVGRESRLPATRFTECPDGDLRRYHPLDDHIEAVIAGPPTTRSWAPSGAKSRTSRIAAVVFELTLARLTVATFHLTRLHWRRTNLESVTQEFFANQFQNGSHKPIPEGKNSGPGDGVLIGGPYRVAGPVTGMPSRRVGRARQ